jgi:hypothetical protein
MSYTSKTPYQLRLQHFQFQRDNGMPITFEEVEQSFLNLDEKLAREKHEHQKNTNLQQHRKGYAA